MPYYLVYKIASVRIYMNNLSGPGAIVSNMIFKTSELEKYQNMLI